MSVTQAVFLAFVQGFTEFLPISSSAHLILMPAFFDWPDQGLAFDIAVHFGTLAAVVCYFRLDLWRMATSLAKPGAASFKLAWQIALATVPLGLAGLAFADYVEGPLRSPAVIAASTVVFGIALWLADSRLRGERPEGSLGWFEAVMIGVAQALALIPGTSRSGVTMTAGLALGLDRRAAGRFAFLLAVPAILMAAAWQALQFVLDPAPVNWGILVLAALISAATAFITIVAFLRLIASVGMAGFAIYRLALGIVIAYVLL
jgi:undecaprenyl-diphosphatase